MTWTKEQKQAYDKQYAKDNKEKLAAYHRKWYQDNKDGLVAEYREANKERAAKRTKAYRAIPENKKKAKAALKKMGS